jgi:hypothetical protein
MGTYHTSLAQELHYSLYRTVRLFSCILDIDARLIAPHRPDRGL